jgi:autotransporter-associated beta strand protein
VNLTKAGTGILTLGGASDYTGDTTITGGTLRLNGGNNRLPVTTNLTINGGDTSGAKLDLNTRSQTVAGLSGGDGTVKGVVTNLATGTGTATLTVTGTSTFDGIIQDGTTARVALTKSVNGTLTLTGDNTYSGSTSVTGGTLLLTGSIGGSTSVQIAGGTLEIAAADRINDAANLTLNSGTLKTNGFGDTVGTLTLSGPSTFDLGSGASIFTFGDSSFQLWSGTLSILNWSGSASGGGTDQLFFGTNEFGLTFDQVASVTFVDPAGFTGTFAAQMLSTGELVAAIPEPSAACALLLGSVGLFASRRSRKTRKPSLG